MIMLYLNVIGGVRVCIIVVFNAFVDICMKTDQTMIQRVMRCECANVQCFVVREKLQRTLDLSRM